MYIGRDESHEYPDCFRRSKMTPTRGRECEHGSIYHSEADRGDFLMHKRRGLFRRHGPGIRHRPARESPLYDIGQQPGHYPADGRAYRRNRRSPRGSRPLSLGSAYVGAGYPEET